MIPKLFMMIQHVLWILTVSDAGEDKRSLANINDSDSVLQNAFRELQFGGVGRQQNNSCQGAEYCIDDCPYDFVDQECQDSSSSSLSGDKYPFVLSLQVQRTSEDGENIVGCYSRFCSAALIYSDVAVTTADCLQPLLISPSSQTSSKVKAVIQVARAQRCLHLNGSETGFVDFGIIHPDYDNNTENNNLGVVVLKKGMSKELGFAQLTSNKDFQGTAQAFSYNWTSSLRNHTSESILATTKEAVVISDDLCVPLLQDQDARIVEFFNKSTEICAIVDEHSNCVQGGGGSPLFLEDGNGATLLGLGSWRPVGECKQPHVFTQVASYTEWIQQQIQKYSKVYSAVPSPGRVPVPSPSPSPESSPSPVPTPDPGPIPTPSPTAQNYQCVDIAPDTTFPCDFQVALGNCETPPYNSLRNNAGELVYCLVSCNLCDLGDLAALATADSVDLIEQCAQSANPQACAEGRAIATSSLVDEVQSNMTEAIASLTEADLGPDPTQPVVRAASATASAVSRAIANSMAEVSLRGVTTDENSFANGIAQDSAEAIAQATAEAFSVAIAEAGGDFTELEASILITDTQRAIANASVKLAITGRGTINSVIQTSYAIAVAQAVANATAQAFAKLTNTDAQAIALTTAQAFNTTQLTCLSICNDEPPFGDDRTCYHYVAVGDCGKIVGNCECVCGTCNVGSEASIATYVDLISGTDEDIHPQQTLNAFGEAFASGAAGVDAIATAFVEAVAQDQSEATASVIAEAFGAVNQIPSSALVDAIAIAINDGGVDVVEVVADGFTLAERGGNANSLAQAISTAFTYSDTGSPVVQAIIQAISTAIANGGCEAVGEAITDAQALAIEENGGDAFAAAIAESQSINNCLQGSRETNLYQIDYYYYYYYWEPISDTYVASTAQGNAASDASDIVERINQGDTTAAANAIVSAVAEGRASAVASGIATAIIEGAPTSAAVEVIVSAVNTGDQEIVAAVAKGIALAEYSGEAAGLSEVFAEGLGNGGSDAEAISTAISEAVTYGGCDAVVTSLAEAQTKANNRGKGTTFQAALSQSAAYCLKGSVTITTSLINGNIMDASNAILAAVALRQYNEVATEVAEALSRGAETFSVAYTIVEAVNSGGEEVVSAFADCFLFLKNSNESALANFLSESVGNNNYTSDAIGSILSFIIDEDGCSAIYSSLDDAERIVNSTGEQTNFRAALPEQVQYCIAFPEQDCKDVYLPGTTDCIVMVLNGMCDMLPFRGVYCKKTCQLCLQKLEEDEEAADKHPLGKKSNTCDLRAYDFYDPICRGIKKQIFQGESGVPPAYMISLQVPKNTKHKYGECFWHFCGGALIAPNIVVTAAHCVDEKYFGKINQQGRIKKMVYAARAPDCRHDQGFDRLLVQKSFIYKEYDASNIQGDVAILELKGSWKGPYLQYQPAWNKILPDQLDLTIMGYGQQAAGDSGYINEHFMSLNMYYLSDQLCTFTMLHNGYTNMQEIFSQQLMICAQADFGGTCEGDSGGPLVIKDQTNEANDILVGINSFGRNVECGREQLTVFAEVGKNNITLWVHEMVREYGLGYGDLDWQTPPPLKG